MNAAKAKYFPTFEMLAQSTLNGIPGVICIDSGVPGPVLGVTVCTHGNEPAGLGACDFLLNEFDLKSKLKAGAVYLVLNNIKAAQAYFDAEDQEAVGMARMVDLNMNRLPRNTLLQTAPNHYEVIRSQELESIWRRFTAALDIHSTTADAEPMIISRGGNFENIRPYIKGFPISLLISNIDQVQMNVPAFSFYGKEGDDVIAFAIEAGQHEKPSTFVNASTCVVSLLVNLGMVDGKVEDTDIVYKEYKIVGSIFFNSKKPDLARKFEDFEFVPKGAPLVIEDGAVTQFAEYDCQLVLPSQKRGDEKTDRDIEEEIAFISLPMRIREM